MATHYKGERISDLLQRIEDMKRIIDEVKGDEKGEHIAQGYADLAIAKAKLTALQGEE